MVLFYIYWGEAWSLGPPTSNLYLTFLSWDLLGLSQFEGIRMLAERRTGWWCGTTTLFWSRETTRQHSSMTWTRGFLFPVISSSIQTRLSVTTGIFCQSFIACSVLWVERNIYKASVPTEDIWKTMKVTGKSRLLIGCLSEEVNKRNTTWKLSSGWINTARELSIIWNNSTIFLVSIPLLLCTI